MDTDFNYGLNTLPDYSANILRVFYRATTADRYEGLLWYARARTLAGKLDHGRYRIGAGVLSALSPNQSWEINIRLARNAFMGELQGTYGANLDKARRILAGETPLSVLGGNKTKDFYRCIVSAGRTNAVCIDRHAIAICLGREATHTEQRIESETGKRRIAYVGYADAYRSLAPTLSLWPSQLQAITWVTWRRLKGISE